MPTFLTRTGSAVVFAIIMLAGLLWNEWAFLVLASIVQVLCLNEYFRLIKKIDPLLYVPSWLPVAIQIISLVCLWLMSPLLFSFLSIKLVLVFPILIILLATIPKKTAWQGVLQSFGGVVYIVLPMILFTNMRDQSILLPLSLVLMIWTNDTMAYIVGSFIGKTPFSEISPKKTWEGTIGGALLTVAGAAVWGYYSSYYQMTDWIILALCAAIAGTMGDLLESKLKRMAGIKDSGSIMPGHGGALDRFDSLLVAIPFAFSYAYIFMPELSLVIF